MSESAKDLKTRFSKQGYNCFRIFAKDGVLDLEELNFLLSMALEDSKIDEDERSVLRKIFSEVSGDMVSTETWEKIEKIKFTYDL